ncbi:hypothetical protein SAMN02745146_0103 [Hymenobacter daecheongensis DSM 21074]|uniref:LysM domain-containing protein n=1 Tax=Hymenobacter daecheongensis DSM 21074 TaxID=1121955 RepID=A0A1M6LYI1_9BACT|nr:LysM domain-containing protein [Hymenobacter daecheongensis]SHJ76254.1 hypothetical protein SAMN02745146_0103 [Hymenobacter daecheongensis DSM 21074]
MDSSTVVTEGQTLLDIALREYGDVAAVFRLAEDNGLAITDALQPGQVLGLSLTRIARPELVQYFAQRQQMINTGSLPPTGPEPTTGLIDHDDNDHDPTDFH